MFYNNVAWAIPAVVNFIFTEKILIKKNLYDFYE